MECELKLNYMICCNGLKFKVGQYKLFLLTTCLKKKTSSNYIHSNVPDFRNSPTTCKTT